MSEVYNYLAEMKTLHEIQKVSRRNTTFFSLIGTEYILILDSKEKIHWRVAKPRQGLINRVVHFDEIFEASPEDVREQFAYHFDIFKNT